MYNYKYNEQRINILTEIKIQKIFEIEQFFRIKERYEHNEFK